MTLRSRLMIGLIATASFPVISFGTDAVNTSIGDMPPPPVRTESGSNDQRPQVSGSGMNISKPPKPLMGTGAMSDRLLLPAVQKRGGDENSRIVVGGPGGGPHVRMLKNGSGAEMGSGTNMEHQIKGLGAAIGKLTPTDREALIQMIREYLTTKGITLGNPEVKKDETERKGWDGSIKGKKTDTEIQAERAALLMKAQIKREAMRKEYVGHVTLMK